MPEIKKQIRKHNTIMKYYICVSQPIKIKVTSQFTLQL